MAKKASKKKDKKPRQQVFSDPDNPSETFDIAPIKEIDVADRKFREQKTAVLEEQKTLKALKKTLKETMKANKANLIEGTKYRYNDENDERREVSIEEGVVSRKVKEPKIAVPIEEPAGIESDPNLKDDLETKD